MRINDILGYSTVNSPKDKMEWDKMERPGNNSLLIHYVFAGNHFHK